jgi:invasion protein IalB
MGVAVAGIATYALLMEPEILSRAKTTEEKPQPTPARQSAPALPRSGQAKWRVRCNSVEGPIDCQVLQSISYKKMGRLSVAVQGPRGSQTPILRLQLPLDIYIPAGATIQIGNAPTRGLALRSCDLAGCFVQYAITGPELAALMNGETMSVWVRDRNRAEVHFKIPVTGFAEAYAKIN